jgi:SNF2 family DNA or RNA helicase
VGRDFLAGRTRALLADQMRVGKTPQAILAAAKVGAERSLVVCPAIAVPQWQREWSRWAPDLPPATVISYDRARRDVDELRKQQWDVLIPDECHFAKNPNASRTKAIYGKDGLGWAAKRIWSLSGTPAPNHAGELWPMMRAFGIVGLDYYDFIRRYCTLNETNEPKGTRADRVPELRELLSKFMLRRTRAEVAPELPDVELDLLMVKPDYTTQSDPELAAALAAAQDDEARLALLRDWYESLAAERAATALAKARPLADVVLEALGAKLLTQTVVFGVHTEALEVLTHRLRSNGVRAALLYGKTPGPERDATQVQFQAGQLDVVVANIIAAGTAIDLSAADHGYFLELDWTPANNAQAANRIVSMTKRVPTSFDIATVAGTVDEVIQRTLRRKTSELRMLY